VPLPTRDLENGTPVNVCGGAPLVRVFGKLKVVAVIVIYTNTAGPVVNRLKWNRQTSNKLQTLWKKKARKFNFSH
jgi:hypothetical protein